MCGVGICLRMNAKVPPRTKAPAIDDADLERLGAVAEVLNLRARAVLIREGEFAPHVFNITTFPHTYKA